MYKHYESCDLDLDKHILKCIWFLYWFSSLFFLCFQLLNVRCELNLDFKTNFKSSQKKNLRCLFSWSFGGDNLLWGSQSNRNCDFNGPSYLKRCPALFCHYSHFMLAKEQETALNESLNVVYFIHRVAERLKINLPTVVWLCLQSVTMVTA